MADDIVSLGLDISSFDEPKKVRLQEYIALFEQLEKYEALKINPVIGGDLTAFNTSIAETTKLIDNLNTRLTVLQTGSAKTTAVINGSTKANQQNTNSLLDKAKADYKAAEGETALAAAQTRGAQAKLSAAQAALRLAQQNLQTADSTEKVIYQERARLAGQEALAAALTVRVFAEKQLTAANTQAAAANELETASINENTAAQIRGTAAVDASAVAQENANTTVTAAKAGITSTTTSLKLGEEAASKLGTGLRSAFGSLRTIAYILPGIGIAGIFNLAFEALGPLLEAMKDFIDTRGQIIEQSKIEFQIEQAINKALSDKIDLYRELSTVKTSYQNLSSGSSAEIERIADFDKARGVSKDKVLPIELAKANTEKDEITKRIQAYIGSRTNEEPFKPKGIGDDVFLDRQKGESDIALLRRELDKQQEIITKATELANQHENALGRANIFDGVKIDKDREQNALDRQKEILTVSTKRYQDISKLLQDKVNNDKEISDKQGEIDKFNEDEARRIRTENTKSEISVRIKSDEKILNDEITSEKNKLAELNNIRTEQKAANLVDFNNVNDNNSSTPADKSIATQKLADENTKVDIKYKEDKLALEETYRQRRLKAQEQIDSDIEEREAIHNEKIYKDDNQSLDKRLVALASYYKYKQHLQDIQYLKDVDVRGLKADDPTAIKEIAALQSSRDTEKGNIQADAEAQAYDITKSSLDKELKTVEETNSKKGEDNKIAYAKELNDLNDLFEAKKIKYEQFEKDRKKIILKYDRSGYDEAIIDDKSDIGRLKDHGSSLQKDKSKADAALDEADAHKAAAADGIGDPMQAQKEYDIAVGVEKAINDAILENDHALADAQEKLKGDELARAKKHGDDLLAVNKKGGDKYLDLIAKIEKAAYDIIKKEVDDEFKVREQNVEERIRIVDEGYQAEIKAVQGSSLTAKDKAALDIQLSEQKFEADKHAAAEEKRLKREQVIFDKDASIAQIIIATALAVMRSAPNIPLEIETAAAGALALASAAAVKIPSYALGTGPRGTTHTGVSRYGEAGPEVVKEPYKSPYLVLSETMSVLPLGTEIIPVSDSPVFGKHPVAIDNSWAQTRWLAKQIKKGQGGNTVVKNNIIIDGNFIRYKDKVLGKA